MTSSIAYKKDHQNEQINKIKQYGEVFTSKKTVEFMLSFAEVDTLLTDSSKHILEPSCGQGEFLEPMATRLVSLIQTKERLDLDDVLKKVTAYDLDEKNVALARERIKNIFIQVFDENTASLIVKSWIKQADFLEEEISQRFHLIVGNPPYIRIENIQNSKLQKYRNMFDTMTNRADIYVAFYEKSLSLLAQGGKHIFICTDRWTKNVYGSALRKLIAQNYSLDIYIDLYHKSPFHTKVMTYPAITVISKSKYKDTLVAFPPAIDQDTANAIKQANEAQSIDCDWMYKDKIVHLSNPFLIIDPSQRNLIKKIENNFPVIEEAGCKVFVGAATGNNKVFIVDHNIDIEDERLLPVVTAKEIQAGTIEWNGKYIINLYENGKLIDFESFPKLKKYLLSHKEALEKRHIAKKNPNIWYRTIDKVCQEKAKTPKLLIPDIASKFICVIDEGRYFPNNSVYYIISSSWPLNALKNILDAGIAQLFIASYSTKMAHGYLRYQAQHLRKIRIPYWESLDANIQKKLQTKLKKEELFNIVATIYDLDEEELKLLEHINE